MSEKVSIKITQATGIEGELRKAGAIVEVDEDLAKNLLDRERAELATVADEGGEDGAAASKKAAK